MKVLSKKATQIKQANQNKILKKTAVYTAIAMGLIPVKSWSQNQCAELLASRPASDFSLLQQSFGNVSPAEVAKSFGELMDISHLTESDDLNHIMFEKHRLSSLLSKDPTKNLAVRSPLDIMNSAQRILSMIYSKGVKKIRLPITGEEVLYYPFFSEGTELTNGLMINGNEKAIAAFVEGLKAQATKDRAGASIFLAVGAHGTGKSEFLNLMGVAAENLTSTLNPTFSSYTFKFTNLNEITELHRFIPFEIQNGHKVLADFEAPYGASPISLLPKSVQQLVLENARPAAEKMLNGMTPMPILETDPWSDFIRNSIIQHYSRTKGRPLTSAEIVEYLDKHIVVQRQIIGKRFLKMPQIESQPHDVDIQGLFLAPNPIVKFASSVGNNHIMSWFGNGKIMQGYGNAVMFDEFFRNPKELQNLVLGMFQSRTVSVGGSPILNLDAVIYAATNTANFNEIKSQDAFKALADRFTPHYLRWHYLPHLQVRQLLMSKLSKSYQQSLHDDHAPIQKLKLLEAVPLMEGLQKNQTTDHRYRIWIGDGPDRIEISPYSLMLMSEIIAATRFEKDPAKAEKVFAGKILTSHLFRNPLERLRFYEGEVQNVQDDEIKELEIVTGLLHQGESGISTRDADRWLTEALTVARNSRTDNTLTPGIAIKVFKDMLYTKKIEANTKDRLEWLNLADEIIENLLIPRLEADITQATANGDRVVQDAYWDVIDEMIATDRNPTARTYVSSTSHQERSIDRERLEDIQKRYQLRTGRNLNFAQIAIFHMRQSMVDSHLKQPDDDLLKAIAEYYAALHTKLAGISQLADLEKTGRGNDETKSLHQSLVDSMYRMGYNRIAIRDALLLVNDYKSRSQQQQQGQ